MDIYLSGKGNPHGKLKPPICVATGLCRCRSHPPASPIPTAGQSTKRVRGRLSRVRVSMEARGHGSSEGSGPERYQRLPGRNPRAPSNSCRTEYLSARKGLHLRRHHAVQGRGLPERIFSASSPSSPAGMARTFDRCSRTRPSRVSRIAVQTHTRSLIRHRNAPTMSRSQRGLSTEANFGGFTCFRYPVKLIRLTDW